MSCQRTQWTPEQQAATTEAVNVGKFGFALWWHLELARASDCCFVCELRGSTFCEKSPIALPSNPFRLLQDELLYDGLLFGKIRFGDLCV